LRVKIFPLKICGTTEILGKKNSGGKISTRREKTGGRRHFGQLEIGGPLKGFGLKFGLPLGKTPCGLGENLKVLSKGKICVTRVFKG